jgi:glycosyltransferase involved in cell wall biosynthesis
MITVSIIIPAYNEINTIEKLLRNVNKQKINGVKFEIIVVDDGSTDGTKEFLEGNSDLYDILSINDSNLGKGGAVRNALDKATGDFVLFQDADLEYNPDEYVRLLKPVIQFEADVVMGSRFLSPDWTRVFYYSHKVGNKLISNLFNILFNTTWSDIYSCYLLYRRNLIDHNSLVSNGWDQQAEILARLCKQKLRLYEVPINYNGRPYEEGKKIRWHHIIPVIGTIIKNRFM